jgi:class 3 adenylate cyclase
LEYTIRYYIVIFIWGLTALVPLTAQRFDDREQHVYEADQLLEEARKTQDHKERISFAMRSLTLAREIKHSGGVLRASLLLGDLYAQAQKPDTALQFLLEAESKINAVGSMPLQTAVYRSLADLFMQQQLFPNARRYYKSILLMEPSNLNIIETLGDASLHDRLDSAEYYYSILTKHFSELGNNPRLVQIYHKLATAYEQQEKVSKTIEYYKKIEFLIEHFGSATEKALLYNNLGKQYTLKKDFVTAIVYFQKSELQCKDKLCDFQDILYANLGIALHNIGESKKGIVYLLRALEILKKQKDLAPLANLEQLLANVCLNSGDIYEALHHNESAIQYARKTKQKNTLANAYRTSAAIYYELYDFEKAYDFYNKSLLLTDSVALENQARVRTLETQRFNLSSAEGQIKYLITRENFKELELAQSQFERERLKLQNEKLELQQRDKDNQLAILSKDKQVKEAEARQLVLEKLQIEKDLRIAAQKWDAERKNALINDLQLREKADRMQRISDSTANAQNMEILRRDQNIAKLNSEQQRTFRRIAYIAGGVLLFILGLISVSWFMARRAGRRLARQNARIQQQNRQLDEERQKSELLLLNILPDETAQELKATGTATPRHYESATVVFTDFVNFTTLSAQLTPDQLINALNECFLAFDEIAERNRLEKIKTIGDAYMCVGGIPVPNTTHATDAVQAALEMVEWLQQYGQQNSAAIFKEMRIGIHTGQVVAGVVGKNKFAYDVWGDAVNLAARLEEYGDINRINISSTTYEAVRHRFACIRRGSFEVRNKGLIEMYFVS